MREKFSSIVSNFKQKVKRINKEVGALYLATKRPDMPLLPKIISLLIVGYALSPIDLIPDFIPVLGLLDDIILIPLGVTLVIKLIPENIMIECRQQADNAFKEGKPKNWIAAGIIILLWITIFIYIVKKILY